MQSQLGSKCVYDKMVHSHVCSHPTNRHIYYCSGVAHTDTHTPLSESHVVYHINMNDTLGTLLIKVYGRRLTCVCNRSIVWVYWKEDKEWKRETTEKAKTKKKKKRHERNRENVCVLYSPKTREKHEDVHRTRCTSQAHLSIEWLYVVQDQKKEHNTIFSIGIDIF